MLINAKVVYDEVGYMDEAVVWCSEGYNTENGSITTKSQCQHRGLWEPAIKDCQGKD